VNLEDSVTNFFPDATQSWQPIQSEKPVVTHLGLAEYESDERTKPGAPRSSSITLRASS